MREITEIREFNVYNFDELSEDAKEKVKEWYLEGQEPCIFSDMCKEQLDIDFPNSNLKVEYQLNIYGKLNPYDMLTHIDDLTEKEIRTIKIYSEQCADIEIPGGNHRYSFCQAEHIDFAEEWIDDLKYQEFRNINSNLIKKFETAVQELFTDLCKQFEKWGYDYFYEIDDEHLEEICESNQYEFHEDGSFYA